MCVCVSAVAAVSVVYSPSANAESVAIQSLNLGISAGGSASTLFTLGGSVTPLFGYSLAIDIVALSGSTGSVSVDTSLTNFFDSQNLITAAGLTRDPSFSLILPSGVNGAFISTNTSDGSTVLATPGVNDVLAQLFFKASADASGQFAIQLGAGSALSDGQGFPVAFDFAPGTITIQSGPIVPLPAPVALGAAGLLGVATRRRRGIRRG